MSDKSVPICAAISGFILPRRSASTFHVRIDVHVSSPELGAAREEAIRVLLQMLELGERVIAEHGAQCAACGCELFCDCSLPCVQCATAAELRRRGL